MSLAASGSDPFCLLSMEGVIVPIFLGPRASEVHLRCGPSGNKEDRIAPTIHRLNSETEGQIRTWGSRGGWRGERGQ